MTEWVNELVDNYYAFLKNKTAVITNTGTSWVLISTPFVGLFNDTIEIYAKKSNGKILLSDDGTTIRNLELIGAGVSRSPKRKDLLERVLLTYGVKMQDEELIIECEEADLVQKKHNLISAIIEINDMYILAKHTISSIFKEDVREYLDEQQIIYTPQFISKGSTGLEFAFDFQIAYRDVEIVIKAFNSLNKLNLPSFLFAWEDIKSVREKVTNKQVISLAIINDEEKDIEQDYLEALKNRKADFILWSERYKPESIAKIKIAS